jgi:predicted MFS family arabinose efflux permease
MTGAVLPTPVAGAAPAISGRLTAAMAAACGLIVANLYYAQPLIGPIARDLAMPEAAASLLVTLTQLGYALGLVLLVPLGDLVENRRLIAVLIAVAAAALLAAGLAPGAAAMLAAVMLVGVASVVAQILVPFAAQLAPDASRGRVVGNVMSGLMLGILLARPVASVIADHAGWRAPFLASAAVMAALAAALARILPRRRPAAAIGYPRLIASLWEVLRDTPLLRRRAAYQAALFGVFSLFWTAVPLLLAQAPFGLTQSGIAAFALAGAAGALAAPVAGRIADRGWMRAGTGAGMAAVAAALALAIAGSAGSPALLVAAAVVLDIGVTLNMVLSQRALYALHPGLRSRLNGLFVALLFLGGAAGSALASWSFAVGGWAGVSAVGFAFVAAALALFAAELVRGRGRA